MIVFFLALAATSASNFTEDFYVGRSVNLAQGFYICEHPNPVGALEAIAKTRDIEVRRNSVAEHAKCRFKQNESDDLWTVVQVSKQLCGPLKKVYGGTMCSTEAHQLVVRNKQGNQRTVIYVQDDYDID